jgi:hypothetical protein
VGATFWMHLTPFEATDEAALRQLQVELFRKSGYDIARLLEERTAAMEQAVRWCQEDDPYDLLEHYRDCLERLRRLTSSGVPDDAGAQVALLREIEAVSSDSAPGVLSLEGISDEPAEWMAYRLPAMVLEMACGTASPNLREARDGLARLADSVSRASAVCFAIYEDRRPVSWCFAGYTED